MRGLASENRSSSGSRPLEETLLREAVGNGAGAVVGVVVDFDEWGYWVHAGRDG